MLVLLRVCKSSEQHVGHVCDLQLVLEFRSIQITNAVLRY